MRLTVPAVLAVVLSGADASAAGGVRFDRVDVISQDSGSWVNYELPTVGSYPLRPLLRLIEQTKVVFDLPIEGLEAGVSIASQSIAFERVVDARVPWLEWNVGVSTRALLPRGAFGGLSCRFGPVRIGLGVSAQSEAAWANLSWRSWTVLPTIGVGVGRSGGVP